MSCRRIRPQLLVISPDATRESLWVEQRIAIHYPDAKVGDEWPTTDSTSLNPDDYPTNGKKAVGALVALARSGGYVYAEYSANKGALIGFVEPNSEVELLRGAWGSKNGKSGRPAVLKSLRLARARTLDPSEIVVVSAGRPKQGALMKWRKVGSAIENMVEGRTGECSLSDLHYIHQEIMCSEYLRTGRAAVFGLPKMARLLLKVGDTLRDVDIAAMAEDGSRIYAQVTYKGLDESYSKVRKLETYAGKGCHLIFFCRCEMPVMHGSMHVVPLELVYRDLINDDLGKRWLSAVSGNE